MSKWIWIVAGPNGAGKTTIATKYLTQRADPDLKKLNADERTLALRSQYPERSQDDLNLLAAQQIDAEVSENIDSGNSFFVETVLSTPKYCDAILKAKKFGYKFGLIYISIHPPELSPQRVSDRVAEGGHNVDPVKAVDRYHRSHQQLRWFARQADTFIAIDNSDPAGKPVVIAAKLAGKSLIHRNKGVNPEVDRVIRALKKIKQTVPTA